MEQSPHSSGGSEIFTNDQQGSGHEYYQVMILFLHFNTYSRLRLIGTHRSSVWTVYWDRLVPGDLSD